MTGDNTRPQNDVIRRAKDLEHRAVARLRSKSEAATAEGESGQQLDLLPTWPKLKRVIPNDLARSAVFSIGHGPREYLQNEVIASLGQNLRLVYTGEQLYQSDEDFFCQLFHLARGRPFGEPIIFTGHQMLKSLGWSTGANGYKKLDEAITRARGATIRIVREHSDGREVFLGGIIANADYDTRSRLGHVKPWLVWLDERTRPLFDHGRYSYIDWDQRQRLPSLLSKWLHSFYSTHRRPYALKVVTLHKLCGSNASRLRRFREHLRSSLDDLKDVSFLLDWEIDERDNVHVERS